MGERALPTPEDDDERRVVENVRAFGWHALHVRDEFHPHHRPFAPGEQHPAVEAASAEGFSYTVGLWPTLGHPELVLTGDRGPAEAMHAILGAAVARVREDGMRFAAGDEDGQVLEGYPVRFGPVGMLYLLQMLTWAHWAARREPFAALQLLLPDRDGRWPGEPAYAGARQPLLGDEPAW